AHRGGRAGEGEGRADADPGLPPLLRRRAAPARRRAAPPGEGHGGGRAVGAVPGGRADRHAGPRLSRVGAGASGARTPRERLGEKVNAFFRGAVRTLPGYGFGMRSLPIGRVLLAVLVALAGCSPRAEENAVRRGDEAFAQG